jgi:LmbE family N-acetylglucosaminyl deacetylase
MPVTLDRLLHAQQRLVVVAPHPDDEVLACGGLVALHAERGGSCLVIAVTDGEASHEGCNAWTAHTLATTRRDESALGLAQLGLSGGTVARLGLPDGKVRDNAAALVSALRPLLRADDLVITTWRLDGHPDHDATGEAAAEACLVIGARLIEAPVWMWHWAVPRDPRVPWERLRSLALSDAALGRKAAALSAHATQFALREQSNGICEGAVLDTAILQRAARGAEHFFV